MEKKTFLNTWKDIPSTNEIQFTIENVECTSDGIQTKMAQNNVSLQHDPGVGFNLKHFRRLLWPREL